jgi:hypothetical protein
MLILGGCNLSDSNSTTPTAYALGGTVSGLNGSGLVLANNGQTIAVGASADGFSFGAVLTAGASYAVTVQTQPTGDTCTVASGSGTAQAALVKNVVVTCSPVAESLGGAVSGLNGAGLVLRNGSDAVSVAVNATSFTLPAKVAYGSSYVVTVKTQPAGVACAVSNGTGTMPASAVTNISVTCTDQPFSLGGSIAGLTTGGLVLANGIGTVSVAANATSFALPTTVAYGSSYAVTVQAQPTGLTCTVSRGSGTMPAANLSNVAVVCADRSFQLEGSISGLTVSGLVLANGTDTLAVPANAASFTMPTSVAYGSSYALTVQTQPTGLTCTISIGSGTMPANDIANITITCADNAYTLGGTITGLITGGLVLTNGSDRLTVAANAAQFTMPVAVAYTGSYAVSVARQPSGLTCTVTDGTGTMPPDNFSGVAVTCVAREWTWVSGPNNTANVAGVYGSEGTPAAGNMPGSRNAAVSWADAAGNLWLYGGYAYNATGIQGVTDDLWQYSLTSGQWTWMGGSTTAFNVAPVYGTQGAAGPNNEPGVRENAISWTDAAGNLWLFGGDGNGVSFNDLWKYDPTSRQWTWVSGSNTGNATGVYGAQGTPAAGNVPGARAQAVSWTDAAGNLWLFGGTRAGGTLNDLWRYTPTSGQWTWMSGSSTINARGVYGTKGTAAAGQAPGARNAAISWTDGAGNLWLFGGLGYGSNGGSGYLNDLWQYSPASGQWTWMSGSSTVNATGVYGTKGTAAAGNVPGARETAVSWTDGAGTLWLFGGQYNNGNSELNDLWQYSPNSNEWTWVSGSNSVWAMSVYGTQGTPAAGNAPGALTYMVSWTDPVGNFWLFGGYGNAATTSGTLNVLWSY